MFFSISNGVREGGILSPKLFLVYIDDPSDKLVKCKVGCYIDNLCMNHVMYADCDVPSNFIICLGCQLINLPLTCDSLVVVFGNQDLFVSPCRDFVGVPVLLSMTVTWSKIWRIIFIRCEQLPVIFLSICIYTLHFVSISNCHIINICLM